MYRLLLIDEYIVGSPILAYNVVEGGGGMLGKRQQKESSD